MPVVGERKTKNGITGEWDGTTWRRVTDTTTTVPTDGVKVGDRKTKDGITGEWDGETWRRVTESAGVSPDKPPHSLPVATVAAQATKAGLPVALEGASKAASGLSKVAEVVSRMPGVTRTLGGLGAGALGTGVLGPFGGVVGAVGAMSGQTPAELTSRALGAASTLAGNAATALGRNPELSRVAQGALSEAQTAWHTVPAAQKFLKFGLPQLGIVMDTITQRGDIPYKETPEKTAARQAEFERRYHDLIRQDLLKQLGGDIRTTNIELK